jgi:hypothetical protein
VKSGRALHLDYEQGGHLSRMRYQRLAAARGIDPQRLQGKLALATFPTRYLDDPRAYDALAPLCEGRDLVIVDSFRAAAPRTDENSSEARVPLDRLARISEATGVSAVVVHHARKPTRDAQGGARMSVRGSGALYDACASVLVFGSSKGEPIRVSHEKERIAGRLHADFRLVVEDVEVEGNPLAGLRVSRPAGETAAAAQGNGAFVELQEKIMALVREVGVVAGTRAVRARLGGRYEDVSAAVGELVLAGVLKRGGTYHEPTLAAASGTDRPDPHSEYHSPETGPGAIVSVPPYRGGNRWNRSQASGPNGSRNQCGTDREPMEPIADHKGTALYDDPPKEAEEKP